MTTEMAFKPAVRGTFVPLIGVAGVSGSGKTLSALKLARGMVGKTGKICVVDTENRRSTQFAGDASEPELGLYDVLDLQPPFTPSRYIEAHKAALDAKADVLVIDSASHEWAGPGGCLEYFESELERMAGSNWEKREKCKFTCWARVGMVHNPLVDAFARSAIPVICCFRAKDKIILEKNQTTGKTEVEKDKDAPISRADLIHEMTMAFVMEEREDGGGYFRIRKRGAPSLFKAVTEHVKAHGDRMSYALGKTIGDWCSMAGTQPVGNQAGPVKESLPVDDPIAPLKAKLWSLCKHLGDWKAIRIWLTGVKILPAGVKISDLKEADLLEVIAKVEIQLEQNTTP